VKPGDYYLIRLSKAIASNDSWADREIRHKVVCPVCGFDYAHLIGTRLVSGNDNYAAGWGGRGDLVAVHFEGECGHDWEICFGFHKGQTFTFVRRLSEKV
jgi:hypothetical protein